MLVKSVELRHEQNGHSKVYLISIFEDGGEYLVKATWGRIGRRPNQEDSVKGGPYRSYEVANTHLQDIVLSKTRKGYTLFRDEGNRIISSPAPPAPTVRNVDNRKFWTKKDIENNQNAFTQALRAALQKGV